MSESTPKPSKTVKPNRGLKIAFWSILTIAATTLIVLAANAKFDWFDITPK